ncbi:MAG TPA: ankyrin repeat domain-containing protein [Gaiellaceae bacterium]|nr:ankyrin repeat domain-containing protein [Gaiellaceae bacterium]
MSEILAALYRGDEAAAAELLAGGPELDVFEAAATGRVERLRELLEADPSLVGAWASDGFTPLHLAAFFRRPAAARLLVERGAPVDVVARNEEIPVTPLQSAVTAGERETAALLLARGADPNFRHGGGFTPLHTAARNGDAGAVELLLANGAAPALADDEGRMPADFARDAGHESLAERLERAAAARS